jgi:hypothetical protein
MRTERRLLDVVGLHAHLMVAEAQVQLGEELGAVQFIEQFLDDWDWKLVFDRDGIEGVEVNAEPP